MAGRIYFHYLFLTVPPLLILGGAMLAAAVRYFDYDYRRVALVRWLSFGGAVAIVIVAVCMVCKIDQFERAHGAFLQGQAFTASHTLCLAASDQNGSHALLGLAGGMLCELRDRRRRPAKSININQTYDTALRPYFRSRFLADFARSQPDFVIDAVAPGSFSFEDPDKQGIASFPELAEIVARDFVPLSQVMPPGRCQRLYVRRVRFAALEKSLIPFTRIAATASAAGYPAQAVDDRSIFETCDDYWLLPKGTLGAVALDFAEAGPLGSVAILNTRNGLVGDRASERVRLSARLGGKTTVATELTLQPFPRWT